MLRRESSRVGLLCGLVLLGAAFLVVPIVVSAATPEEAVESRANGLPLAGDAMPVVSDPAAHAAAVRQQADATTLAVSILSSPYAVRDSNALDQGPRVFVVEAVITNTGSFTATDVVGVLDYNEDPAHGWVLAPGEVVMRGLGDLAPGEAQSVYWFAGYPAPIGASHRYTVTAYAENAMPPVWTWRNAYGNPVAGRTVQSRSFLSTGNNGIVQTEYNVVVGVGFTVSVDYMLSLNPERLILGPVGNLDFNAGAYRLLSTEIRFYNGANALLSTLRDRVFVPGGQIPAGAVRAVMDYRFIAVTPSDTQVCPYTGVMYSSSDKYDKNFCAQAVGVAGALSFSLTKHVSSATVQQGETLTYTIQYTNNGVLPLSYVWIWDQIDPAIGQVLTSTVTPTYDPDETTGSRVVWAVGHVGAAGQPDSTGVLSFAVLVDGNGVDLADQTQVVNHALFGIEPGGLPPVAALTSTVTSTVLAPSIAVAKSDGLDEVTAGDASTYTLWVTNTGSVAANGLVITDVLPADVVYAAGSATPPESRRVGDGTLAWDDLGPLPPGGSITVQAPVTVRPSAPDDSVLTNRVRVRYQNPAGYVYARNTALDATTVRALQWYLRKNASSDVVTAGATLTYTLDILTSGPSLASDVTIVDVLPAGVTFGQVVSADPLLQGPVQNGQVLTWYTPTLNALQMESIVFTVTVDPGFTGVIINQATVSSTVPLTNSTDSESTTVIAVTALEVAKRSDLNAVAAGELLTYTLVYTNAGPSHARNAWITDTLSSQVTFIEVVSADPALPDPTLDGQKLVWDLSTLAAGDSGVIVYTVAVKPSAVGLIENRAWIMGDASDSEPNDNLSTAITTVGSPDQATIYGWVFDDRNNDGIWDVTEPGVSDVLITMDGALTTTTDAGGLYYFITPISGTHTISQTDRAGYFSTTPNEVHTDVMLGQSYRVDFGDVQAAYCTCPSDGYEDDEAWTQAGWLRSGGSQDRDFCDDAADWTMFQARVPGVYTITTSLLGQRADTVLTLYDTDGLTPLQSNDDTGGSLSSRIVWQASTSGAYYLAVTNKGGVSGCGTGYVLTFEPTPHIAYLPLTVRGFIPPVGGD